MADADGHVSWAKTVRIQEMLRRSFSITNLFIRFFHMNLDFRDNLDTRIDDFCLVVSTPLKNMKLMWDDYSRHIPNAPCMVYLPTFGAFVG